MKVTLIPKAKEIVSAQVALGNYESVDEAVNSFILSTQSNIEKRLDELRPIIEERMKESEDNDIEMNDEYFTKKEERIKNKFMNKQ